jgi:hypothetical protein
VPPREPARWDACGCRDCRCADLAIPKSFCTYTMNSLHAEKSFQDNGAEVSCERPGPLPGVAAVAGEVPGARVPVRSGRRPVSHPSLPLRDVRQRRAFGLLPFILQNGRWRLSSAHLSPTRMGAAMPYVCTLPGGTSLRLLPSCSAMILSGSTVRRARARMTAPSAAHISNVARCVASAGVSPTCWNRAASASLAALNAASAGREFRGRVPRSRLRPLHSRRGSPCPRLPAARCRYTR